MKLKSFTHVWYIMKNFYLLQNNNIVMCSNLVESQVLSLVVVYMLKRGGSELNSQQNSLPKYIIILYQ